MSKRYAALYEGGSFNVCEDGVDLVDAPKKLGYIHSDEDTKLVEVEIKVVNIIYNSNPKFAVVTEHSAECPTCGTEVFIPAQKDTPND